MTVNPAIGPAVKISAVHHHVEGKVFVRTPHGTYSDTEANFGRDWDGEALPFLPDGAVERIYEIGVRHCIQNDQTVLEGGPMPWPLGDKIIAGFDRLIERKTVRLNAEAKASAKTDEELAKQMGLPWPPRDIFKELDDLTRRVEALENK